jgi:hypothetical protein
MVTNRSQILDTGDMDYSRVNKERPQDTVIHEIRMLRFCFQQCHENWGNWTEDERRVYLESYLLHYRNLIEFLRSENLRSTDLKLADVLGMSEEDTRVVSIKNQASNLHSIYWEDISQFLQHLTDRRHKEEKGWNINKMFEEVNPILEEMEALLP